MGIKWRKLFSFKTIRPLVVDLLPDLLNAIPHASDPELDALLQIIAAEVKRRVAATHTSTQWQSGEYKFVVGQPVQYTPVDGAFVDASRPKSPTVADAQWQPPKET
jgi:hypothetical protein